MNWKKKKNKKKYDKDKLVNNLVKSTAGLTIIGITSTSVTSSFTGVSNIVFPFAAGAGCVTGIPIEFCSSWLEKKEQNYIEKYA